jgi:Kdo2-lipid IVA lauroyltransferase/acyltransferase
VRTATGQARSVLHAFYASSAHIPMTGFLFNLIGRLPLAWVHAVGAFLGQAMFRLSASYRALTLENLRSAGYTDDATLQAAVREAGKMVVEWAYFWNRSAARLVKDIPDHSAQDPARAVLAQGKGIIFLTPHHGAFELAAKGYAARVGPITVLYSRPKLAWLQRMIDKGRAADGVHLATADLPGVRALFAALKRGEAVGILPDQTPRNGEGVWADFFGRPAYTMTLVQRLHRTTGAPIMLGWAQRHADHTFSVKTERFSETLAQDPVEAATQINRAIEAVIRRAPEQYLWAYNRYKQPKGAPAPPARTQSDPTPHY